jgi:hypothetical protein
VRLKINRKSKCALHSCIENPENFRAFNKTYQMIEILLVSMGIELVINMSAINFDMTFIDFLKLRENNLNS